MSILLGVKWRLYKVMRRLAFTAYTCQCCVGQEYWHGCYCAYHDAWSPEWPDGPWWRRYITLPLYRLVWRRQ